MAGSDLFVGTLDVLILKTVSWGPMHGYAIGRWIRHHAGGALAIEEGALYPALHRLERRGLLAEEWGLTETNRQAKFYKLTPAGRQALRAEVSRWREYSKAVDAVLAASRA